MTPSEITQTAQWCTIKDLVLGATLTSIEDREEYLKKQAEAQFAVKDTELVSAVRKVLDRHKS